jgi:Tfp pilus assembly protein PilO
MNGRRAPLIAGVVAGVLVLLTLVVLVLPKMGEVGETNDQLDEAKGQEITLQAQLKALEDAEAAAPDTQDQIDKLDEEIPPTADLPGLFEMLQSAADRSAVDFFTFSPGTPLPDAGGAFSVISSAITVTGTYLALDEYLYNLETLPRAAKVMTVAIIPQGSGDTSGTATVSSTGLLQMQLTVQFYTTDASAGPGSQPGPTQGTTTIPGA